MQFSQIDSAPHGSVALLQLQREREALSCRDSLTGVAKRRMFDALYPVGKLLAQKELLHGRCGVGRLVTVSIGAGSIVPGFKDDPAVFIDRIDRRLYQAKSAGRDQVCDTDA